MAAITHNHVDYQARIDFVQTVLQEQFGLKVTTPMPSRAIQS